jgi:hypothetical protein
MSDEDFQDQESDSVRIICELNDAGLSILIGSSPSREREGFSLIPNWRLKRLGEALTASHAHLKATP